MLLEKERILPRPTGARLQEMLNAESKTGLIMGERQTSEEFLLRRARVEDAAVIAWHRARMFQDMGELSEATFEELRRAALSWSERTLASGEYVGWLGAPKSRPDAIVGGAGIQLRQVAPHPCPLPRAGGIGKGRHAIVLNVFTEPEWRRRGLAMFLIRQILDWTRAEQLDRLVLHASAQARPLYEKMGFVLTNEMRYAGD